MSTFIGREGAKGGGTSWGRLTWKCRPLGSIGTGRERERERDGVVALSGTPGRREKYL
jgi:hypothetical protein